MLSRSVAALLAPALLCGISAAIRFQVPLTNADVMEAKPEVDQAEANMVADPLPAYRSQMATFVQQLLHSRKNADFKFDEQFFRDTCDLSEHERESFNRDENKVSQTQSEDDRRWQSSKKCENAGIGFGTLLRRENFRGTSHECAQACATVAVAKAGHAVCCEHHRDDKLCLAEVGWQAMQGSNYRSWRTWWRKDKLARLVFQPASLNSYNPDAESGQVTETENDQEIVGNLLTEVNDMSIDGILDHLLSFYICMRWVPDHEFVKLAQFELSEVSMDEKTQALSDTPSHDDIIQLFLQAGLTPLRCTSQTYVQNYEKIDTLLNNFNDSSSAMSQLYTQVKSVYEAGDGLINFNRVAATNQAMHYDASKNGDSVFLQDMRSVARRPEILPWPTFLRSSNYYTHHDSSAKNLFMICFGPRIASFPHKRASGKFVLADQNMAGCNGFWDIETMTRNMNRIKKLFAPEMCFEYALRRELKAQFLRTFVSMNEEFDKAMANSYTKKVHELDPTQGNFDVGSLGIDDPEALGDSYKLEKYKNLAGLVAKAHAKWVICPTKAGVDAAGFGNEDNVFRDPAAYEKWIGQLVDDTIPECRTMDDTTGCAKCVIAVKDVHNCHARMNVSMATLLKAIKERKYPYYATKYQWAEHNNQEGQNSGWSWVEKTGVCVVRKSKHTYSEAGEDLEDLRDAFFNINDTDAIVNLFTDEDPGPGGRIEAETIYTVGERRAFYHDRTKTVPTDDIANVIRMLNSERVFDVEEDFAAKYVFTDDIAARDNRVPFKVDYFVSCPCSQTDHAPQAHFDTFGSQGLAEYWNR